MRRRGDRLRLTRPALLGAITGVALVLAAPPHGLYPLVLVAFVPLLRAVDGRHGAARAALAGWIAGVVMYLGVFRWLPHAIAALQSVDAAAAWALFALFAALHALQFALAAGVAVIFTARTPLGGSAMATAAAWVLLEWSFPKVFPWSIGAALGPDPLLRQTAALGGVYGMALLVMAVNALLAVGTRLDYPPGPRLFATGLAVGMLILALLFGVWRQRWLARTHTGPVIRIAVVQGAIAPTVGGPRADPARDLVTYRSLSRAAAPAADLLVWPENALAVYLRDNGDFAFELAALVEDVQRPLLLGALDRSGSALGELNAAYLFLPSARARPAAVYHKTALLPFGEYVPGAAWWPGLRRYWRTTGDFLPGAQPTPLPISIGAATLWVAPSICFEAIRPAAFNDLVRRGAALLVNLTDDSWFASPAAAAQHLELARLRAVETGRWLARASNSGISAFVDPSGRVVGALPFGVRGTLWQTVETGGAPTPYVRHGDWILLLCAGLVGQPLVQAFAVTRGRRAAAPPALRR